MSPASIAPGNFPADAAHMMREPGYHPSLRRARRPHHEKGRPEGRPSVASRRGYLPNGVNTPFGVGVHAIDCGVQPPSVIGRQGVATVCRQLMLAVCKQTTW